MALLLQSGANVNELHDGGTTALIAACENGSLPIVTALLKVGAKPNSWLKMASTLFDDTAPSASLDCLKARAAPTQPGAQPEPLGSLPWPQELASGRPKVEGFPLSTTRPSLQRTERGRA